MFEADVACAGRHAEGRAQSDRRGGHRHHQQNRQRRRKHRLPGGQLTVDLVVSVLSGVLLSDADQGTELRHGVRLQGDLQGLQQRWWRLYSSGRNKVQHRDYNIPISSCSRNYIYYWFPVIGGYWELYPTPPQVWEYYANDLVWGRNRDILYNRLELCVGRQW